MKRLLSFLVVLSFTYSFVNGLSCEKEKITLDVGLHVPTDTEPRLLKNKSLKNAGIMPFDITFINRSKKPIQINPACLQPHALSLQQIKNDLCWTKKKTCRTAGKFFFLRILELLINITMSPAGSTIHIYDHSSSFFDYTGILKGLGIGLGSLVTTVGGTAGIAFALNDMRVLSIIPTPLIYFTTLHLLTITLNSKYLNAANELLFCEPITLEPGHQISKLFLIKEKEFERMYHGMIPLQVTCHGEDNAVAADFKIFWGPTFSVV